MKKEIAVTAKQAKPAPDDIKNTGNPSYGTIPKPLPRMATLSLINLKKSQSNQETSRP